MCTLFPLTSVLTDLTTSLCSEDVWSAEFWRYGGGGGGHTVKRWREWQDRMFTSEGQFHGSMLPPSFFDTIHV